MAQSTIAAPLIKYVDHTVTLVANANVTPFTHYYGENVNHPDGYVALSAVALGGGSKYPIVCKLADDSMFVYSTGAITVSIRCTYIKA